MYIRIRTGATLLPTPFRTGGRRAEVKFGSAGRRASRRKTDQPSARLERGIDLQMPCPATRRFDLYHSVRCKRRQTNMDSHNCALIFHAIRREPLMPYRAVPTL